jgi:hypothetical protein
MPKRWKTETILHAENAKEFLRLKFGKFAVIWRYANRSP